MRLWKYAIVRSCNYDMERIVKKRGGEARTMAATLNINNRDWLTPHQVAEYLGVKLKTIYRWLNNNEFPGARQFGCVWRIPREAVKPQDPTAK